MSGKCAEVHITIKPSKKQYISLTIIHLYTFNLRNFASEYSEGGPNWDTSVYESSFCLSCAGHLELFAKMWPTNYAINVLR